MFIQKEQRGGRIVHGGMKRWERITYEMPRETRYAVSMEFAVGKALEGRNLLNLPSEIWRKILECLAKKDVLFISLVAKGFREILGRLIIVQLMKSDFEPDDSMFMEKHEFASSYGTSMNMHFGEIRVDEGNPYAPRAALELTFPPVLMDKVAESLNIKIKIKIGADAEFAFVQNFFKKLGEKGCLQSISLIDIEIGGIFMFLIEPKIQALFDCFETYNEKLSSLKSFLFTGLYTVSPANSFSITGSDKHDFKGELNFPKLSFLESISCHNSDLLINIDDLPMLKSLCVDRNHFKDPIVIKISKCPKLSEVKVFENTIVPMKINRVEGEPVEGRPKIKIENCPNYSSSDGWWECVYESDIG